jgi:hypothetical protein
MLDSIPYFSTKSYVHFFGPAKTRNKYEYHFFVEGCGFDSW